MVTDITDLAPRPALCVGEREAAPSGAPEVTETHRLDYWFLPGLSEPRREYDVVSRTGHRAVGFAVPDRWRELRADFRQQVLNVPFADLLTRVRPREVRVDGLHGCSLDLPRLAASLGCEVSLAPPSPEVLDVLPARVRQWVGAAIAAATNLDLPAGVSSEVYGEFVSGQGLSPGASGGIVDDASSRGALDYALYEFVLRDHPLLWRMQEGYAPFFEGCTDILDVGCGTGVFLGILEAEGHKPKGVDRNPPIVRYARELGYDVDEADALAYLEQCPSAFDGIYCSHFVEHLDVEGVERLMRLLSRALRPGGRVVLVFPDPESIRSQLLGFWRDPEHVRFYHPELVELMGRSVGLDCVWHSHRDGVPHQVVSFPLAPSLDQGPSESPGDAPMAPLAEPPPGARRGSLGGLRTRILQALGVAPMGTVRQLEERLRWNEQRLEAMEAALTRTRQTVSHLCEDTRRLWQVNQTWAWEDNAVLVLRRPERDPGND